MFENFDKMIRGENKKFKNSIKKQDEIMKKTIRKQQKEINNAMKFSVTKSVSTEKRVPIRTKRKKEVYEKYKHKCAKCGIRKPLQIHHINMKNKDNRLSNLILLCANHHYLEHQKKFRKKYKKYDLVKGYTTTTRLIKKKKPVKKKRKRKIKQNNYLQIPKIDFGI